MYYGAHQYRDTSDLNAPYAQWHSALQLQGLGQIHRYADYSNLNAQWNRSRPAIHGLGAVDLWNDPAGAPFVVTLQTGLNQALSSLGCRPIAVDGKLGGETCGAYSYLGKRNVDVAKFPALQGALATSVVQDALHKCTSASYSCTASSGGGGGGGGGGASTPEELPTRSSGIDPGTMWLVGGIGTAVALIGGALWWKARR